MEIKPKTRTVFKCKKCGFVQDVKDKKGEYKEWQYHCGIICKMTVLRSIIID